MTETLLQDTPLVRARAALAELIAFPTISVDGNLELISYVQEVLGRLGARSELTRDETGQKANLFATIGPDIDGGVILSGHTDVVPVEGQDWSTDPFLAHDDGARIYGRGACDMKGFLACALAMTPAAAEADLKRPLHLSFTYDEEVGCLGARVMLAALAESGRKPRACIIGEPTSMRVIEGHKGCHEYSTEFSGLEGHGSRPELGVNAVEYAVRYVSELLRLGEDLQANPPPGSPFVPPWTTISVGRIAGGIAHNVIANQCQVDWEFRPANGSDARRVCGHMQDYADRELIPRMRAVDPAAGIFTRTMGEVSGLAPMPDSEAVALATELAGRKDTGVVSFGTEGGLFQEIGIPTVICGPGSIAQAHKPDEFVDYEQLDTCLGMIERLIANLEQE